MAAKKDTTPKTPGPASDKKQALETALAQIEKQFGALDGGADGLDFYRVLVRQNYDAVRPGGWLVLEIGYAQAEAVLELGKAAGWQAGTCRKDAGGNDRVVFFRKPLENPV